LYGLYCCLAIIYCMCRYVRTLSELKCSFPTTSVGCPNATATCVAAHERATSPSVAGHRRFATLQSSAGIPSAADRTGGFHAALAESDIEPELSISGTLDRDGGHAVARQIAEHLAGSSHSAEEGPLCVFAPADVMAL